MGSRVWLARCCSQLRADWNLRASLSFLNRYHTLLTALQIPTRFYVEGKQPPRPETLCLSVCRCRSASPPLLQVCLDGPTTLPPPGSIIPSHVLAGTRRELEWYRWTCKMCICMFLSLLVC